MASRAQKRVLWQQRLAELEASGMTRTAYCTARGIGRSTLQRWQRRLPGGLLPDRYTCITPPHKVAWAHAYRQPARGAFGSWRPLPLAWLAITDRRGKARPLDVA